MRIPAFAAAAVATALLVAPTALAETLVVTEAGNGGPGTLRDRIAAATDGDVVEIAAGVDPALTTEIAVEADLTIRGQGARATTVSGSDVTRIFTIAAEANVLVESLTLGDGRAPPERSGGAVLNFGALTIRDAVVRDSDASSGASAPTGTGSPGFDGGGIFSEGLLLVDRSTFVGNRAGSGGAGGTNGGGIDFNGGSGGSGGAIRVDQGSALVRNSTFFDNAAGNGGSGGGTLGQGGEGGEGGAVSVGSFGGATVLQSTLAGNRSGDGGGFSIGNEGSSGRGGGVAAEEGGAVAVGGSILAGNSMPPLGQVVPMPFVGRHNCAGNVVDLGGNLAYASAEDPPGRGGCPAGFALADPGLANAPADNGGPTDTIAIAPGGPAVNAIEPSSENCAHADQRGVVRPQGGRCEIGALEIEAPVCEPRLAATTAGAPVSIFFSCSGGEPFSYGLVGPPLHGTVSAPSPGSAHVVYTPAAGFSGADSFRYTAVGPGGAAPAATVTVSVAGAPPKPEPPKPEQPPMPQEPPTKQDRIELGKVKPDSKKGTAKIVVDVPGPGELTLKGKGLKKVVKDVAKQGKVSLTAKPKGKQKKKLEEEGKLKVPATLTFVPEDGAKEVKKVTFVLRDKGARKKGGSKGG